METSVPPSPAPWNTATYAELRRIAAGYLAGERSAHTLAPTDLVHEAWLRMQAGEPEGGAGVGLIARAMRQALVDHARRRCAQKRGSGKKPQALEELPAESTAAAERDAYVVALDAALEELAAFDPELVRVVELRFFAGLDRDSAASELALSPRTVERRWQLAKGWLHRRVGER